jgi:hypothetical protein
MPREPPVTSAVRPLSENKSCIMWWVPNKSGLLFEGCGTVSIRVGD